MSRLDGTDDGEMDDSDDQQQQFKPTAPMYGQERLKQQALEMHKLLNQFQEEFEDEEQNTYYILSKSWFDNWKQSVSYDEWVYDKPITKKTTSISLSNYNKDLVIEYSNNECFKYFPLNSHPWNQWLKSDLVEGVDYIVINKAIDNFINQYYRGSQIVRNSVGQGKNKKVVVNLLKFYAILMVPNTVNQIAQDNLVQFEKEQLQVDENTTISDYYQVILKTVPTFRGQYNNQNGVRLWRYTNEGDPHKALFAEIKKQVQDLDFNDELVFNFSGDPIEISQTTTFKQLNITDKDIVVVEFQSLYKPWCVRHSSVPVEGRCEGCGSIAVLNVVCICKKVSYCNEKCRINDERFHLPKCDPYGSDDEQVKQMVLCDNSVRGVAGLANLGNTCFMNSGTQCLSNTYALSEYFIQNKYFDEINLDNPLGTKGQLVRKYGSLIKKLWCGNKNVVIPTSFKKAVGQFQPMFKGFQQHDSSELITFLLDGLHEDLNRVKKKPYVETNDGQDRTDFEVAKDSWECHIARNQSIIVDMMHGQYKSTLRCPKCNKISITFDPFLTVGLAIPNKKTKQINIKVIKSVVSIESKYLQFDGSKKTMPLEQFAKEFIFPEFKIEEDSQLVYFSHFAQDAQDPFELTQEINFVRKNSKKGGLTAKVLEPFEAKIEPANRIFLSFVQKTFEGYSGQQYKRTIQPATFVIIQKEFTFKQIHIALFITLMPIFCDLIQPNEINIENEEEVRKYYEERIQDKYYQVQFKSNAMYWKNCGYCGSKNCTECPAPYSDDSYETVKTKVQENDMQLKIELVIFWNQSPFQNIKPSDMYSYHSNQQYKKQMEEEKNNEANNTDENLNNKGRFIPKTTCYQMMQPQKVTLQECLTHSEQPEELAEDNTWYCKQCKDHVRAFKSMQIYKASDILIFSLKRFKASHGLFKQKLETFVEFPVKGLDLTEFILNKNKPQDYESEAKRGNQIEIENNAPLIYDLYAVSNHFGGMGGGHYTAFAKNHLNGRWYNFDDGHVTEMDEENVISKSAYVLFYKRRTGLETENTQPLNTSQEN